MSYPTSLDEYAEQFLRGELALREARRAAGLCDYCNRAPDTKPCRFPDRHRSAPARESAALQTPETK